MTLTIAIRNLLHDRVRLAVTLTGVVFAVVLIAVQLGLFVGFTRATSCVIDNTDADIWIAAKGVRNFDVSSPMRERKLYQVLSVPGVARAEKCIVQFSNWKKPGGGLESIEIVGYDLASGLGGPWRLVEGRLDLLSQADTVVADRFYFSKLGIQELGQEVEIRDRRARVVAVTDGIRSFTTSPYIFTSFSNALRYTSLESDQMSYILVRAAAGVSAETLRSAIAAHVDAVDVFTKEQFSLMTQWYWMFTTGAGLALLIAALLGLVVGMVVVAQTLYATTMDHIAEFGTLRAMGAPNSYIYRIIIDQALISAVIGYSLGICVSLFIVRYSEKGGASILLPWQIAASLFVLTVAMCVCAALISINKVMRIDPAMVFKGR